MIIIRIKNTYIGISCTSKYFLNCVLTLINRIIKKLKFTGAMKTIYANLSFNSVIETEGWLIIIKNNSKLVQKSILAPVCLKTAKSLVMSKKTIKRHRLYYILVSQCIASS